MSYATSRPAQTPPSIGQHYALTDGVGVRGEACCTGLPSCPGLGHSASADPASLIETEWRPLDSATQPALWSLLFGEAPTSIDAQTREGQD